MNSPAPRRWVVNAPSRFAVFLIVLALGVLSVLPGRLAGAAPAPVPRPSAKPRVNIGVIGHVDHGKTTLTAAITHVLARNGLAKYRSSSQLENASNVQARGVAIHVSRVEYETAKRRYTHVDCPAHVDYIKGMITGALPMDGAILVVSAVDGPMPQTREHIRLARLVGTRAMVVFLSKCDLVADTELLDLVELEVRELLTQYGFAGDRVPVIRGSAKKALEGDTRARQAITKLIETVDVHIPTPVREREPGAITPHSKFQAEIYVLSKEEGGRPTPVVNGYRPQFLFHTTDVNGVCHLPADVASVMPGDHASVEVELIRPVALTPGLRFVIRDGGRAVGVGVVTKVLD